jgi:TetR/AcrR family transcriptional repressor of mexJK operon
LEALALRAALGLNGRKGAALNQAATMKETLGVRGRGGRPTKEDAERRDARVLSVAASLFIRKGFSATSMDEIARLAAVAKRTLYAQYPNKGEIFAAVVCWRVAEAFNPRVQPAGEHPDAEAALLQLARDVVRICTEAGTSQMSRLLVSESVRFPELTSRIFTEGTEVLIRSVAEVLEQLCGRAGLRLRDGPEKEARRFCDLMVGMSALHVAGGVSWRIWDDDELRARVRLFIGA